MLINDLRCKWQRSTPNLEVLSWITLAAIKTLCQGTRETSEAPYSPQLCMGKLGCASALTWSVYPVQCTCRCVSSCRWLLGQVWTSGYWLWTVTSHGEMNYSDPPNPLKHWQLLTFKCFKKKITSILDWTFTLNLLKPVIVCRFIAQRKQPREDPEKWKSKLWPLQLCLTPFRWVFSICYRAGINRMDPQCTDMHM